MTPKARFDRFLRLPLAALGPAMALLAALFLLLEPAGVHAAGAVL